MEFQAAVKKCLKDYVSIEGRAPRSEYWWFVLFGALVGFVTGIIDVILFPSSGGNGPLNIISALLLVLPGICAAIRRLHDRDKSGWWLLLAFIPIIGAVVLLIWYCLKGTEGPNRFGEDPLRN